MKKLALLLCFGPLLMSSTCEDDDTEPQIICTTEARAGLNVTVTDAANNATLFEGVSVIATEGQYSEILEPIAGNAAFAGAWERAGYYVLTVNKEGYQTAISDLIVVNSDQCHVIPRVLTISLQPE